MNPQYAALRALGIPAGHHDATRFVYFWAPPNGGARSLLVRGANSVPPSPQRVRTFFSSRAGLSSPASQCVVGAATAPAAAFADAPVRAARRAALINGSVALAGHLARLLTAAEAAGSERVPSRQRSNWSAAPL
jgi:hypothetical protein